MPFYLVVNAMQASCRSTNVSTLHNGPTGYISIRLILYPTFRSKTAQRLNSCQSIPKMSLCIACNKPLVVEIEADDEEQYEMAGPSSGKAPAAEPETVPDDVQPNCGCHFHW